MEESEPTPTDESQHPEERKTPKASAALYRLWMKNKEQRKRKQQEELKRLNKAAEKYGTRKLTQQKYEAMRRRHDALQRQYQTLNYYNDKFLKDYANHCDCDQHRDGYRSLSSKYVISVKDIFSPKCNVFSPISGTKKNGYSRSGRLQGVKSFSGEATPLCDDILQKLRDLPSSEKKPSARAEQRSLVFFSSILERQPPKKVRPPLLPPVPKVDSVMLETQKMRRYLMRQGKIKKRAGQGQ